MVAGYIYILFNPGLRANHWKIGLTTRTPQARARECSRDTGVPDEYEVAYQLRVRDCHRAERLVHQALAEHRVKSGKEFFVIDLDQAIRICWAAGKTVGLFEENDSWDFSAEGVDTTEPDGAADPDYEIEATVQEEEVTEPDKEEPEVDFVTGAAIGRRRSPTTKEIPIEDHLRKVSPEVRQVFYQLRERILALDEGIEELSCQPYVRYRRKANFAEVTFHKRLNTIRVWIADVPHDDPLRLIEKNAGGTNWRLNCFIPMADSRSMGEVVRLVSRSMEVFG